mmetsp:Transcript_3524/g.7677  ORF Transcript_3524/g.7677 Transcript_3524/m.7677 type:complete len:242 (+) Transcript_3524:33-758(+)
MTVGGAGQKIAPISMTEGEAKTSLTGNVVDNLEIPLVRRAKKHKLLAFDNGWKAMMTWMDSEELSTNVTSLATSLGVICALIISFIYQENGRDLTTAPGNMWGDDLIEGAQDAYTIVMVLTVTISFSSVVITSRVYMDFCVVPASLRKSAAAAMGGASLVSSIYVPFFVNAILLLIGILLRTSIVLPMVSAVISMGLGGAISIFTIFHVMSMDKAVEIVVLKAALKETSGTEGSGIGKPSE